MESSAREAAAAALNRVCFNPALPGCFLFCWTPFFVVHTARALCLTCHIPPGLMSTVTWLGYVNSALNPIIYTIFNTEFKKFFKKCFRGCC